MKITLPFVPDQTPTLQKDPELRNYLLWLSEYVAELERRVTTGEKGLPTDHGAAV